MSEETRKKGLAGWWSRVSKVKLIVWAVIILAVGLGFLHQYIIHSDSYIRRYISAHETEYKAAGEVLLNKPTSSSDFTETLSSQVKKLNKFSIELIMDSPHYSGDRAVLEAVEELGVQDVKSTDSVVRFYQSYRFVVIYAPGRDTVEGAESAGDGWFYVKSF